VCLVTIPGQLVTACWLNAGRKQEGSCNCPWRGTSAIPNHRNVTTPWKGENRCRLSGCRRCAMFRLGTRIGDISGGHLLPAVRKACDCCCDASRPFHMQNEHLSTSGRCCKGEGDWRKVPSTTRTTNLPSNMCTSLTMTHPRGDHSDQTQAQIKFLLLRCCTDRHCS